MTKTSAEHMMLKVDAALANLEELGGQLGRARTQLQSVRYSLGLLKAAQARTVEKPAAFTPEGWSALTPSGHPPSGEQLKFGPRHGCSWNKKETDDLRCGLVVGYNVAELATKHRRSTGSINSEIGRWFAAAGQS